MPKIFKAEDVNRVWRLWLQDKKPADIATELNTTVTAVNSMLQSAKRKYQTGHRPKIYEHEHGQRRIERVSGEYSNPDFSKMYL